MSILEHFPLEKEALSPLVVLSSLPSARRLATADLVSVPVDVSILDIVCGQSHRTGGLPCLASFTLHGGFSVPLCRSMGQDIIPVSLPANTPLCG